MKCKDNITVFRRELDKPTEDSKCVPCSNYLKCSEEESLISKKEYDEKYDPNNLVNGCLETIICNKCRKNLKKTDIYISVEIKEEKDFHILSYSGINHYHKKCWENMQL